MNGGTRQAEPGAHQSGGAAQNTVYIGLGANLGDARQTLSQALAEVARLPETALLDASSMYRTAPLHAGGPDYINAVARLSTGLSAHDLLTRLQALEQQHGRTRPYLNAPRTLDLDILLFGTDVVRDARLVIPHPRMHERAFVLIPLAELNPTLTLAQGQLGELIARCQDQRIEKLG